MRRQLAEDSVPSICVDVYANEACVHVRGDPMGDLFLGQAGSLARLDQKFPQSEVMRAVDGLAHAAPNRDNERSKLIPLSDYPK